jgi:hypothetical protein
MGLLVNQNLVLLNLTSLIYWLSLLANNLPANSLPANSLPADKSTG